MGTCTYHSQGRSDNFCLDLGITLFLLHYWLQFWGEMRHGQFYVLSFGDDFEEVEDEEALDEAPNPEVSLTNFDLRTHDYLVTILLSYIVFVEQTF